MNPTPRVSQFPSTLRALAPRLLAAALFCSALPSQAKDPTGQEQGQAVPADCPSKGIINWSDSTRAKVGDHFWDYLSVKKGFGLGYGPWTKLSPAERCKIIKDNKDPANDAFRGYEYLLKTTDPAWYGMAKLEPEKQIEILDRLLPRIKKDRMEVFNTFGVRDPYRTRLEGRQSQLEDLKRLAQSQIQAKKGTEAAKKQLEGKNASLKTVKKVEEKIKGNKGKADEQDLQKIYTGGKERKDLKKASGSPGTRTSGNKVKVATDITTGKVPGGDQNFATKYTGPGKQDPTKAPPVPSSKDDGSSNTPLGAADGGAAAGGFSAGAAAAYLRRKAGQARQSGGKALDAIGDAEAKLIEPRDASAAPMEPAQLGTQAQYERGKAASGMVKLGAATGTVAGATIGFFLGGAVGGPAAPVTALVGAAKGAAIGAAAGGAGGAAVALYTGS